MAKTRTLLVLKDGTTVEVEEGEGRWTVRIALDGKLTGPPLTFHREVDFLAFAELLADLRPSPT